MQCLMLIKEASGTSFMQYLMLLKEASGTSFMQCLMLLKRVFSCQGTHLCSGLCLTP